MTVFGDEYKLILAKAAWKAEEAMKLHDEAMKSDKLEIMIKAGLVHFR